MTITQKKCMPTKKATDSLLPVALRVDAWCVRLFACDDAFYLV